MVHYQKQLLLKIISRSDKFHKCIFSANSLVTFIKIYNKSMKDNKIDNDECNDLVNVYEE